MPSVWVKLEATAAELRAVPAEKFGLLKGPGLSNSPVPIAGDEVLPYSIAATIAGGPRGTVAAHCGQHER